MITISKKKFKHAFKSKMYSLYAQPVEEASKDEKMHSYFIGVVLYLSFLFMGICVCAG